MCGLVSRVCPGLAPARLLYRSFQRACVWLHWYMSAWKRFDRNMSGMTFTHTYTQSHAMSTMSECMCCYAIVVGCVGWVNHFIEERMCVCMFAFIHSYMCRTPLRPRAIATASTLTHWAWAILSQYTRWKACAQVFDYVSRMLLQAPNYTWSWRMSEI